MSTRTADSRRESFPTLSSQDETGCKKHENKEKKERTRVESCPAKRPCRSEFTQDPKKSSPMLFPSARFWLSALAVRVCMWWSRSGVAQKLPLFGTGPGLFFCFFPVKSGRRRWGEKRALLTIKCIPVQKATTDAFPSSFIWESFNGPITFPFFAIQAVLSALVSYKVHVGHSFTPSSAFQVKSISTNLENGLSFWRGFLDFRCEINDRLDVEQLRWIGQAKRKKKKAVKEKKRSPKRNRKEFLSIPSRFSPQPVTHYLTTVHKSPVSISCPSG